MGTDNAQRPRLVVLASGRGSNLQAILDACGQGQLDAEVAAVVSNQPQAECLQRARDAAVTACCIDHRNYAIREQFDAALLQQVVEFQPDLVLLAGFMRILTPVFVEPLVGRLMNIHPSLLPHYPGLHTHQRALDAGDSATGATVHFVTTELDGGPPVLHARVPILSGDNAHDLARRVLHKEHIIYPIAAAWFIQGRLHMTNSGVTLDGHQIPANGLQYSG